MSRTAPVIALTIVLAAALGLSGCAPTSPGITASTSELMQSTIGVAAEQAAAGDAAGSLATLNSLEAQLNAAIGSGDVSAARAAGIQDAIDLVRADLQPAPVTTPAPSDTVLPATTAAPTGATSTDPPAGSGNGNGNNGNGNGNGKGKGKDK